MILSFNDRIYGKVFRINTDSICSLNRIRKAYTESKENRFDNKNELYYILKVIID